MNCFDKILTIWIWCLFLLKIIPYKKTYAIDLNLLYGGGSKSSLLLEFKFWDLFVNAEL